MRSAWAISSMESPSRAQQQAGTLGRRQAGKGGLDGFALGATGRQVGAGGGVAILVAGREGQPGQTAAMAQRVEGRIGGDAVEPSRQYEITRRGQGPVRLEEGVLSQIVRLLDVTDHAQQIAVDSAMVAREHLIEGAVYLLRPRRFRTGALVQPAHATPLYADGHRRSPPLPRARLACPCCVRCHSISPSYAFGSACGIV